MNGSRRSRGVHFVDLVEHEQDRSAELHELVEHPLILVRPAQRLDHEQVHVGVVQRGQRRAIHVAVHRTARAGMQSRRVDENDLRFGRFRMPRMRCRVVCGLGLTMLILRPSNAFSSVDLPTFGRPTIAANRSDGPLRRGWRQIRWLVHRLLSQCFVQCRQHELRGGLLRAAPARAARASSADPARRPSSAPRRTDCAPRRSVASTR